MADEENDSDNVLLGVAIIVGSLLLFLVVPGGDAPRATPAAGAAGTLFGAIFFAYWAAILLIAYWKRRECWLFRLLNVPGPSWVFGLLLLLAAFLLEGRWYGIL